MSESTLTKSAVFVLLLFFSALLIGWIGAAQHPDVGKNLLQLFEKEVAGQVMGASPLETGSRIFLNNLEACLLLFLGGASFGILTIFIMSLNGIVIGAIMQLVTREHSIQFLATAILPHGIFEIPGFILAGALGMLFSQALVDEYYGTGVASGEASRLAWLFVIYVLPLIAVAGFVEAFITPQVIQLVV